VQTPSGEGGRQAEMPVAAPEEGMGAGQEGEWQLPPFASPWPSHGSRPPSSVLGYQTLPAEVKGMVHRIH